ncbi:MAG: hypothetical protein ACI83O_000923 [Patescibacteria group bacterium]|jgi:hypothetical protein
MRSINEIISNMNLVYVQKLSLLQTCKSSSLPTFFLRKVEPIKEIIGLE